jgi:hypothetical protein
VRLAPRTTLLAFAIGLALAVPATASGATTIGSVIPWSGNETLVCDDPGGCTVVPTSISGTPVAVPFDGVMVRWTALVPEGGDPVDLRVLRPAAGGYVPVAKSELQSVDPDGVFSQGVRIRVAAGDLIGLDLEHGEEIGISAHASEDSASLAFFPKLGDAGTRAPTDTYADDFEMHFRATIERDADNDGYGDETQDECPQLAQTVGGCPNGILELALDPARRFMPRKRHWDGVVIGETTRIQTSVRASTVHPVPGVAITFELGAGLAAVSAAGPAQCAVTPAKVSCPVGVMPNGSTATVSLDVRATSQDSGRIDARVTSAARTDGR